MKLRMVPGTAIEVRTIHGRLGLEAMILSFDRFQSPIRRQFPLWAVDAAIEAETNRRRDITISSKTEERIRGLMRRFGFS